MIALVVGRYSSWLIDEVQTLHRSVSSLAEKVSRNRVVKAWTCKLSKNVINLVITRGDNGKNRQSPEVDKLYPSINKNNFYNLNSFLKSNSYLSVLEEVNANRSSRFKHENISYSVQLVAQTISNFMKILVYEVKQLEIVYAFTNDKNT